MKNGTFKCVIISHKELTSFVTVHLVSLENFEKYFPSLCMNGYAWVRNPFFHKPLMLVWIGRNLKIKQLIDIKNDGNLKLCTKRCLSVNSGSKIKRVTLLLLFFTLSLFEIGFFILTNIKTKTRERLLAIEDEMKVVILNVHPDIIVYLMYIQCIFKCVTYCYV